MGKLERDYLFPEIQPYDNGMLDVGDGNRVFWETCGNPSGKPALVLHGGPGSGCTPWWRRLFDPDAYRVVLFDQRGCGRSTPNAGTATADLTANTTLHLLKDIELLRRHLEIDQWLVLGGSWGSTLGLAYAQQHAELVSEMVLFSVVTTSKREVRWITRDIGRMFPAAWERFRDGVPLEERDGSLVDAYSQLLHSRDRRVREQAAIDWCAWEEEHVKTHPEEPANPRYADPAFRLCFARLVTHYWRHAAWIEDEALFRGMPVLANIPAVLIHGARDASSPLDIPWRIAKAWPASEFNVVESAGHGGDLETTKALVDATRRFA
ncbi:MAG: prolyl aminopeptidase [Actinomycetota bacterium]|nr:prolyl aminopeptidase [Actinomycetota bacterium]